MAPEAARRDAAIAAAGQAYAAGVSDVWELYQREGALGVARAACPGGSEEKIQQLTEQAERSAQKACTRNTGQRQQGAT